MDAQDQVLLQLADPAARPGLLGADALLQLATVCYDIDPATVTGPTTAVYDRVDLAVTLPADTTAAARFMRAGDALPWDVTATWNAGQGPVPGADAILVARLVVRAPPAGGTIEQVDTAQPDVDAAFAAAIAGLPASATPEQVRAALRLAAEQSLTGDVLTDTELDAVLTGATGSTAADPRRLGHATGGLDGVWLRLAMSAPPNPVDATPLVLPVVVAVLVADAATPPRELLRATTIARRAALDYPLPEAPPDAPPRRADRCVCWLLPAAVFDDSGWPGGTGNTADAQRTARLAAARGWLATGGIAVVTT
jgi:hypothetical protein